MIYRSLDGLIILERIGLRSLTDVKDDENLSSMKFNRFEERVKQTLKLRDMAEEDLVLE